MGAASPYSPMAYHDLEVGDVLKTSFQALVSNFITIGPITAICLVPAIVGRFVFEVFLGATSNDDHRLWIGYGAFFLLGKIIEYVAQAAVTFVVVEHLAGRKVELGHGLQYTLSRFFPITFTALLVSLIVLLASCLLFVPGIVMACMLFVAVPATVVEPVGPFQAIGRSIHLTRGRLMTVFLVLLTYVAISMSTGIGAFWGVGWVGEILRAMIFGVMGAVVYVRLRGINDGIDAVSLASVFE